MPIYFSYIFQKKYMNFRPLDALFQTFLFIHSCYPNTLGNRRFSVLIKIACMEDASIPITWLITLLGLLIKVLMSVSLTAYLK